MLPYTVILSIINSSFQGARRKILQSIAKLRQRAANVRRLEAVRIVILSHNQLAIDFSIPKSKRLSTACPI